KPVGLISGHTGNPHDAGNSASGGQYVIGFVSRPVNLRPTINLHKPDFGNLYLEAGAGVEGFLHGHDFSLSGALSNPNQLSVHPIAGLGAGWQPSPNFYVGGNLYMDLQAGNVVTATVGISIRH